jgi:tRNA (guanosine-2'-O-)-methyltransferase
MNMPDHDADGESRIAAVNRRELSSTSLGKTSKWPRTTRRRRRIEAVLQRRQPDLTVVLEDVHDPQNVSAVLRTCDAVGVLGIHLVYTIADVPAVAFARTTSASAAKWIEVTRHVSIDDCYQELRQQGFTIVATALADDTVDLYQTDLRPPTAIVFGNEMRGLSEDAVAKADSRVLIPMFGMVQSLNISVACAVTLYEAMRQRREAGDYAEAKIVDPERTRLIEEWLKR